MFLLLLLTFPLLTESTQCGHSCSCPLLTNFVNASSPEDVLYSEGPKCEVNLTCIPGFVTMVSTFGKSTIPIPSGADGNTEILVTDNDDFTTNTNTNIYELFGLVCENGTWYFTKYPYGLMYYAPGFKYMLVSEFEGKDYKSEILKIYCGFQ